MEEEPRISINLICNHYNIEVSFVNALHDVGLIELILYDETPHIYESRVGDLEKYIRLHQDLGLNLEGLEVVAQLLERVQNMQEEIVMLKYKLHNKGT